MAKFITEFKLSFRPFVLSSALLLLATPLAAKPKSQCNLLASEAECVALQVANVSLCQWVAPQSFTVNGQRKAYCRTSGKSITREQFEALQAARTASTSN